MKILREAAAIAAGYACLAGMVVVLGYGAFIYRTMLGTPYEGLGFFFLIVWGVFIHGCVFADVASRKRKHS